jgi:hypothetical protein
MHFSWEGLRHRDGRRPVLFQNLDVIVKRLSSLYRNVRRLGSGMYILSSKDAFRPGEWLGSRLTLHLRGCETEPLHLIWAQLCHVFPLFARLASLETWARLSLSQSCKCLDWCVIRYHSFNSRLSPRGCSDNFLCWFGSPGPSPQRRILLRPSNGISTFALKPAVATAHRVLPWRITSVEFKLIYSRLFTQVLLEAQLHISRSV